LCTIQYLFYTLTLADSAPAEMVNGVTKVTDSSNGDSTSTADISSSSAAISKQPNLWIMKPVGLSRGRGIEMISDIRYVNNLYHYE
jgi:hypothetical protein